MLPRRSDEFANGERLPALVAGDMRVGEVVRNQSGAMRAVVVVDTPRPSWERPTVRAATRATDISRSPETSSTIDLSPVERQIGF
jgi:hypothetical protein